MPHIHSKVSAWKKNYNLLRAILSRSGVGFNARGNYMIDCEDDQWEQIVTVDAKARLMRYKAWPYYDSWAEIFGNDIATGKAAEDMADAWNDVSFEENHLADEGPFTLDEMSMDNQSAHEGASESGAQPRNMKNLEKQKLKKRKVSEDTLKVCEVLGEIGRATDTRLSDLAKRIGYQFDATKARNGAFVMLGSIPNLSLESRFNVCDALPKKLKS